MRKKKTAVIGLGLSGEAAAELLLERGWAVTVFDDRAGSSQQERSGRLRRRGAIVHLGKKVGERWGGFEMLIASPGIPSGHPLLARARRERVPVISEVELASRFLQGRLVAVTGTNGKTTTVSLLVEIFCRAGVKAVAGGNIGYPLCRIAREGGDYTVVVAEISSFQLERVESFRPKIAVFLNLSSDHLDRYPDMKAYGEAKLKIFARQGRGDRAVFPEAMASFLEEAVPPGVEKITWNGERGMIRIENGELRAFFPGGEEFICREEDIAGRGPAFRQNAQAAAAAARGEGVAAEDIAAVLKTFSGIPHRLEYVSEVEGVAFYNDSKATNPAAAAAALESFTQPVIWLAGGSDKGLDFSSLGPLLPGSVKRAILLGETREKLRSLVAGKVPFQTAFSLAEAVNAAFRAAGPGDVVLLSPGCASFDMFKNYRVRGELFKSLVGGLSISGSEFP
jgi:UDP-N-acetylmuramoylalanine--D-glutamate ligase